MVKHSTLWVMLCFVWSTTCLASSLEGFVHEGNPAKKVTHAGALLIKKYPANHPDGHGEQLCILLGHDRNFNAFAPPAGHVDPNKDFIVDKNGKWYSSSKALKREVMEETGGIVTLSDDFLQNCPMLYSPKYQDLLAVIWDDSLSCANLSRTAQRNHKDPQKEDAWKEMDYYSPFPVMAVIATAQIMKAHFDNGGTIHNLPAQILSARKANHSNAPLVWVNCRGNVRLEVDAHYMAAIADTLPQFQQIIESWALINYKQLPHSAMRENFFKAADTHYKENIVPHAQMLVMMGVSIESNKFTFITQAYEIKQHGIKLHELAELCNKRLKYMRCHEETSQHKEYMYKKGSCPHVLEAKAKHPDWKFCEREDMQENLPVCFTYAFLNEPWIHEISTIWTDLSHPLFSNPVRFLRDKGYEVVDTPAKGDVVYYLDTHKKFAHVGIYQADNTVLSKFSVGAVYQHQIEVVPYDSQYYFVVRKVK